MGERRVVLAIDGNSLLHRAFHSQASTGFRAADGKPMWAVRGLLAQLVAAVDRVGPDVVVVGFDDADASERRDRWPQYKATRTDKLEALIDQLACAVDLLRQMGVAVIVPPGLEADDVLASVANHAPTVGARTVVVTSDRDAFALIDEHTSVLRVINGGVEASPLLTPERLILLLGIAAHQYADYAAFRGDNSDNLPGVRGVGPKTAARLLSALGSAQAVFEDAAAGGALVAAATGPACARMLASPEARASWELNRQVMAMRADLAIDLTAAGVLPLPVDAVRAAYEPQRMPWTTASALRALAHHESTPVPVPQPVAAVSWPTSAPPRRFPPLPPKKAKAEQLGLFDWDSVR